MEFIDFARGHGLIIRELDQGKWVRVPTDDHPHSRNGAYIYDGASGAVQNWATMQTPATWRSERKYTLAESLQYREKSKDNEQEKIAGQRKAASKAGWIIKNCVTEQHAYLDKKGFGDAKGLVWYPDEDTNLLAIPMFVDGSVCGVQLVDKYGGKKFLKGQRTDMATHVIDNKGINVYCEGYATALSVRAAMAAMKERYKIHVCFSAGNMVKVATRTRTGIVIADHDFVNKMTGKRAGHEAAAAIGLPFWMSDVEGEDFNDFFMAHGKFKSGMAIQKLLRSPR